MTERKINLLPANDVRQQAAWRHQIAMPLSDMNGVPMNCRVPAVDLRHLRSWLRANCGRRWGIGEINLRDHIRVYLLMDEDMVLFLLRWSGNVIWYHRI